MDAEDGRWAVVLAARPPDRRRADRRRRRAASSRMSTTRRAAGTTSSLARRLDHAAAEPVSPWRRPRSSRRGSASPARPGPSPSSAPARWACRSPAQFASHGWSVIAVDIDPRVVDSINDGQSHVGEEPGLAELVRDAHARRSAARHARRRRGGRGDADVVVLIVPVILDDESRPDHRCDGLRGRGDRPGRPRRLDGHLRDDPAGRRHPRPVRAAPRGRHRPAVEPAPTRTTSYVAFSPERLYSGAALRNLATYPKLVGGLGPAGDRAGGGVLRRACSTPRSWP